MQPSPRQVRLSAYKLIAFQVAVAGLTALVFQLLSGELAAKSAFKGGLVAALPNFVFALFAFWTLGRGSAEQAKTAMMRGHSLKLILTIVLFVVVMQQQIVAGPLMTGFVLTLFAQWATAIFFKH
ncbi:ATP synthase subunit I [Rheinheimera soli]|uniref:ATP synthase subunit I n=1 Tax=Rheinheimera soli TaxID=443616 RepID=UPI001E30B53C|nr:ATP synthase subunit I [Rheinheimera soli]